MTSSQSAFPHSHTKPGTLEPGPDSRSWTCAPRESFSERKLASLRARHSSRDWAMRQCQVGGRGIARVDADVRMSSRVLRGRTVLNARWSGAQSGDPHLQGLAPGTDSQRLASRPLMGARCTHAGDWHISLTGEIELSNVPRGRSRAAPCAGRRHDRVARSQRHQLHRLERHRDARARATTRKRAITTRLSSSGHSRPCCACLRCAGWTGRWTSPIVTRKSDEGVARNEGVRSSSLPVGADHRHCANLMHAPLAARETQE